MTQEDKQLLLKDLCARLPYGVKCVFHSSKGDVSSTITKIDIDNETISHKPDGQSLVYFHWIESGEIIPYLRPMSSMTEKEKDELRTLNLISSSTFPCRFDLTDWYNEHHFDYRGLIEKGLAIEAPEEMYKIE